MNGNKFVHKQLYVFFTAKYLFCNINDKLVQLILPEYSALTARSSFSSVAFKGDNKIDDLLVMAKALAAEEMASESKMQYIMIPSTKIMKENVI